MDVVFVVSLLGGVASNPLDIALESSEEATTKMDPVKPWFFIEKARAKATLAR